MNLIGQILSGITSPQKTPALNNQRPQNSHLLMISSETLTPYQGPGSDATVGGTL